MRLLLLLAAGAFGVAAKAPQAPRHASMSASGTAVSGSSHRSAPPQINQQQTLQRRRRRLSTDVATFSALSSGIASDTTLNLVGDITFTSALTISGKTGLTITSSVGAKMISDRSYSQSDGGLFYVDGATDITFKGVEMWSGSASDDGGCVYATGSSTVTLTDVVVMRCVAYSDYGGGLHLDGATAVISGSSFTSCSATFGGGVSLLSSAGTFSGCSFTSCDGSTSGGGIRVRSSTATVSSTWFSGCTSNVSQSERINVPASPHARSTTASLCMVLQRLCPDPPCHPYCVRAPAYFLSVCAPPVRR